MKYEIRTAYQSEIDQVYMMGFDVWAENSSESEYLASCRSSPKYRTGNWYVLTEDESLVSSLIVYKISEQIYGIGSIATPLSLREKGFATKLINGVIGKLETDFPELTLFLYSDIKPEFYEKFNFTKLPIIAQRYKSTTCMVRGKRSDAFYLDKMNTPEYF